MSKQKAKKNDELETTETPPVTIKTETMQELVRKKAEIQTRIYHLNADLVNAQVDMAEIDSDISLIS